MLNTENLNQCDYLVISHEISRDLYNKLTSALEQRTEVPKKCTMFLTTFGGDPHAGFRIARCLRHYYDELDIVVFSYCKSAGTLIAIAADNLAICNKGELGPLDIQVMNPNEMLSRSSGLDIQQALRAIDRHAGQIFVNHLQLLTTQAGLSTRLAGKIATNLAVGQTKSLYAQVDPLRIGELERAMQIALAYGKALNKYSTNLKPEGLESLISSYPSHSYVIDRKEAGELFERVRKPNEQEHIYCDKLRGILETQREFMAFIPQELVNNDGVENVPNQGESDEQPTDVAENEGASRSDGENAKKAVRKNRRNSENDGISPEEAQSSV